MTNTDRDKGLAVIGKLLRKAEATAPAEAEALLAKAQELATRHSIDLAVARLGDHQAQAREVVEERSVTIGRRGQHHIVLLRQLFTGIAKVNEVSVVMRGADATLYPIGMPEDLDATEALYRSLAHQMSAAADQWLTSGEYRALAAHAGSAPARTTSRGHFYEGFVARMLTRLQHAHDQALHDALEQELRASSIEAPGDARGQVGRLGAEVSSTALALRAKTDSVTDFLAQNYPKLGVRRQVRRARPTTDARASRERGRRAAERARLTRQRSLGA